MESDDLREFFHVKNVEDVEIKMSKIKEMLNQLHSFGWAHCQELNKMQCSEWLWIVTVLCPPLWCLFGGYNCYSCVHNCRYRAASRIKRILEVYERAGKYSNLSQI